VDALVLFLFFGKKIPNSMFDLFEGEKWFSPSEIDIAVFSKKRREEIKSFIDYR
jgi:hypothetical protein